MTDIIDVVQLQGIEDSLVHLFEITLKGSSTPDVYLTSGLDEGIYNLYFPDATGSTLNEYVAIPITIEGLDIKSDGPQSRPSLSVANLITLGRNLVNNQDGESDEETWQSILQSRNITKPEDILGSKLTYRRTLLKNTFKVGDTPTIPNEFPKASFVMDRITAETSVGVIYELSSPIDLEGVTLPNRVIVGKYCPWTYQGIAIYQDERSGCTWPNDETQGIFYDIDDNQISGIVDGYSSASSYSVGDKIKYPTTGFVKIWQCITAKPSGVSAIPTEGSKYWKRIDICGKTLKSCKKRFQGISNYRSVPLPFGGFPGTRKFN